MAADSVQTAIDSMLAQAEQIRLGGGPKGIERQHRHGRLTARERKSLKNQRKKKAQKARKLALAQQAAAAAASAAGKQPPQTAAPESEQVVA